MAAETLTVKYDGPALSDHLIPVRDLAPALIALGDLFSVANAELHPDGDGVQLQISATKEGSFAVNLVLGHAPGVVAQLAEWLTSTNGQALTNLVQIVSGVGSAGGLFGLIAWKRNRPIAEFDQELLGDGRVKLTAGRDQHITYIENLTLVENPSAMRHARDVVAPLEKEGIDELCFGAEHSGDTVRSADLRSFAINDLAEEDQVSSESEMLVSVLSASFDHGSWRVNDGDHTFAAQLEDDAFRERIVRHEQRVGAGDTMKCIVRRDQKRLPNGGISIKRAIVTVLDYRPAPPQMRIDV